MNKKIRVNAFDMNCVGHIQHGMWTHPRDRSTEYNTIQYWDVAARHYEGHALEHRHVVEGARIHRDHIGRFA